MPAVESQLADPPAERLAHDPLRLARVGLAVGVEEHPGALAAHGDPTAEGVPGLELAQPREQARGLFLSREGDGDAPVLGHGENLPQPTARKEPAAGR
jgi:hypothetical protein